MVPPEDSATAHPGGRLQDGFLILSVVSLLAYLAVNHPIRAFLAQALRLLGKATGSGSAP